MKPFGTVRQRQSGRWQAVYQIGPKHHSRMFVSEREAAAWLAAEQTRIRAGDWCQPDRSLTVGRWFSEWLPGRPLAPRTAELYGSLWRLHLAPTFEPLKLVSVDPLTVRRWHAKARQRAGAVTVAKSYRLLSVLFGDAARDGMILRTPCTLRGAGSERPPAIRVLSPVDVERLAAAVPSTLRLTVLLAAYGGLRWGEIAGLAIDDVDVSDGTLQVRRTVVESQAGTLSFGPTKSRAGYRKVRLPASVVDELAAFVAGRPGLVFATASGGPLRRSNFRKVWTKATASAGLAGVRFHDLRHTSATWLTTNGATLREVQQRLGHSTSTAAMRYQHVVADRDLTLMHRLDESRRRAQEVSE